MCLTEGIAHLEALEILSNQSEKKVHSLLNSLSSEDLAAIKPQLLNIKNAFELDDNEEDEGNWNDKYREIIPRQSEASSMITGPIDTYPLEKAKNLKLK